MYHADLTRHATNGNKKASVKTGEASHEYTNMLSDRLPTKHKFADSTDHLTTIKAMLERAGRP